MKTIPIVDMESADFKDLSTEERLNAVGDRILHALKGIGFVYLLNHGLPEPLCQSTFQSANSFFALPLETKMNYHRFVRTGANGFTPLKGEVLSRSEASGGSLHELKEAWDMKVPGEDMPTEHAPDFCRHMEALMAACAGLSLRVLHALEGALRRPGLFTDSHRDQLGSGSGAVLRAVHYPPLPEPVPAGAVRCATHSDWGSLTLLLLQDDVDGLEVLSRSGGWVPAPPVAGAVLCNVGDLMEIWTGGEIVATKHRVRIPEEERVRRSSRLSLVFFSGPDDEVTVTPPADAEGYQAVNAGKYLTGKYLATMPNAHLRASMV